MIDALKLANSLCACMLLIRSHEIKVRLLTNLFLLNHSVQHFLSISLLLLAFWLLIDLENGTRLFNSIGASMVLRQ